MHLCRFWVLAIVIGISVLFPVFAAENPIKINELEMRASFTDKEIVITAPVLNNSAKAISGTFKAELLDPYDRVVYIAESSAQLKSAGLKLISKALANPIKS